MKAHSVKKASPGFTALDFFAGSGLVTLSLEPYFDVIWANDICSKKANVYTSNHGNRYFHLGSIEDVKGNDLPDADLSWASFPCQDLSLAGKTGGIHAKRSGLVWEWLRIIDEMPQAPEMLVAENVAGFLSSAKGEHYKVFHNELIRKGYKVGPVLLDAVRWTPQSRPRIFVVAIKQDIEIPVELKGDSPSWLHNESIIRLRHLDNWVWWQMPIPEVRQQNLVDIIDWNAPFDNQEKTERLLSLVSLKHLTKLNKYENVVAAGYKRTRNGKQRLELRFDGVAGCLRTPQGGSSRQYLIFKQGKKYASRLLAPREIAQLMGASNYSLPEKYNDAYRAMGDAVAVPAVNYLAKHLLFPLTEVIKRQREREEKDGTFVSTAFGL